MKNVLIASVAAALLGGCVSMAYGPINDKRPYGFKDKAVPDQAYMYDIMIVHPDGKLAMDFWHQRAAEICGGDEYKPRIYSAEVGLGTYSQTNPNGYTGTSVVPGVPKVKGYATCTNPEAADAAALAAAQDTAEESAPSE